ncbi:MAG: T9SS type A sorting domain-containing protein [Crocinitomicaceae bacterium]
MAGQDIAWSTFDAGSPYLSTVNSNYLNTYMGVGYSADGSTANSTMNPVVTDNVFATAPTMTIVDIHGGNMYPDELVLANQGVTIYNYSGGSKIGAIRQWTSHKSVYFGIDMGMVQNATNGEQIIAMSHDWFYGLLSTEEFDQAMLNLNAYPNPAVSDLTISFSELPENGDLKITDATGRIIYQTSIKAGESNIKLNVNQFENGSYFYTVSTGSSISEAKQIQVIK